MAVSATIVWAGLALALAAGRTETLRHCNEAGCRAAAERPIAKARRPERREPEVPQPNPNAARDAYLESRSEHSM